ncbi:GNAT family N-acetyltransferase [Novosphingobium pentaromativorans]|nr:GNAT family N-acetyltransferase [Novosphingobium pentaromativorans]AIT82314.1 GNAT family acetyltransferase [Novosphingobium pentaromativorans US6-1]
MTDAISGPDALTAQDLPQAAALSAALSWPHRLEDWRFGYDLGHGLALRQGGRLVGTAMAWDYGPDFATVGSIIVDSQFKGQRLGSRIFDALMDTLGERSVILAATLEGLELYRRRGFVGFDQICQHQGIAANVAAVAQADGVEQAKSADLPAVLELDAAATGMPRRELIARLVEAGDLRVLRAADGRPRGYAITREFGRGHVVGPVVAATEDDAQVLITDALSRLQGRFVRIDTSIGSGLGPWLESQGLVHVDTVEAMVRGERPLPKGPGRVFAISSQSLG